MAAGQVWSALLIGLCFVALRSDPAAAQQPADSLRGRLELRVRDRPGDASSWRLLGRAREQDGDRAGAFEAFSRAVDLDPLSAAAHFDLARMYFESGHELDAARHFTEAAQLAPDSEYAADARAYLKGLPDPTQAVEHAGFNVRRFDRTNLVPGLEQPGDRLGAKRPFAAGLADPGMPAPLSLRLETGLLYNTNVALAPTSRDLFPDSRESFQFFVAPELEYAALDTPLWRAGPTLKGYFSLNEGPFRELNLQSYQPGLFVERLVVLDSVIFVPRLAYDFTHDEFDGATFANRHALAFSNTVLWSCTHETVFYWAGDHTSYADDGALPELSSRDGWTNSAGASHRLYTQRRWLESVAGGIELQRADTEGANFTYNGIGLYADAEIPLAPSLWLLVDGGWTYRDYPDADLDPSRNEHIWHAGAKLRKHFNDHWSAALVVSWDRFDSDNELFAADRAVAGVVSTLQY